MVMELRFKSGPAFENTTLESSKEDVFKLVTHWVRGVCIAELLRRGSMLFHSSIKTRKKEPGACITA